MHEFAQKQEIRLGWVRKTENESILGKKCLANSTISIKPSRMTAAFVLSPYFSPSVKPAPMATIFYNKINLPYGKFNRALSSNAGKKKLLINDDTRQQVSYTCNMTKLFIM
jgi:hypothetical protein